MPGVSRPDPTAAAVGGTGGQGSGMGAVAGVSESIGQAVKRAADAMSAAYLNQDAAALVEAMASPVMLALEVQHPGLGSVHLACEFARILSVECPPQLRDAYRVPLLEMLVGGSGDSDEFTDAFLQITRDMEHRATLADAKAFDARIDDALPLAQQFMRLWVRSPTAVPVFVHAQSARAPERVAEVWGVLFLAVMSVRSQPRGKATSGCLPAGNHGCLVISRRYLQLMD